MAQHFAREHSAARHGVEPDLLESPSRMRAAAVPRGLVGTILSDATSNALRRKSPGFSAASPLAPWQRWTPFAALAVSVAILAVTPTASSGIAAVALALPFALVVMLRLLALYGIVTSRVAQSPPLRSGDGQLPTYSILVALYREAEATPGLVRALEALDYPHDKLEVVFLIEEDDQSTRRALSRAISAPYMRTVTVPEGAPRTKPRALTYGLQSVRGELIAVFDAEDVPDRLQLRHAAAAFASAGDDLACVQAKLGLYNPLESWFSRQFTIEYACLFEALLPIYVRAGIPIPLSGTSNHFRRKRLVEAGGWDPFNLTEDADLGLRFARLGFRVDLIESTTWEEAPATWRVWSGQRTRWIKGWMQTYIMEKCSYNNSNFNNL
jgi:cellulose synthase/poly-beta-1,6-N-acetylglucosamine synthase-like glycosyltransferase